MNGTATLVVGLAALGGAILLAAVLVLNPGAHRGGVAQSIAALDRFTLKGQPAASPEDLPLADRVFRPFLGSLHRLAVRLSPAGTAQRLQKLLDKAGNPGRWTPERLFAYKGLGLVGLGFLGALIGSHRVATLLIYALVGGAAGFWLPDLLVYNKGLHRQEDIEKTLPDALDMLTVSVEAGLGFDAAMSQVARNTEGPIAGEFYRVLQEMQIGKSRMEALRALGDRTTVPDLRTFVSAIVQADGLGIPIAHVLREQAREMRIKRHQRAEEKAQKVPVKMMFPLVMFILPALFIIVIGPGVIQIIHNLGNK